MEDEQTISSEQKPSLPVKERVLSKIVFPNIQNQQEYLSWQREKMENSKKSIIAYTFLTPNNTEVEYIGVSHSLDVLHQQNDELSSELTSFIAGKDKNEVVVMYEGGVGELRVHVFEGITREQVIQAYGEAGLLCLEAKKLGLKVVGMEPPVREMYEKVKAIGTKGITDDTIAVTEMFKNAVVVMHENNASQKENPDTFTTDQIFNLLTTVSKSTGWREEELNNILKSLEEGNLTDEQKAQAKLHAVHEFTTVLNNEMKKQIGKKLFDGNQFVMKHDDIYEYFAPGEEKTGLNAISNATSQVRDQYVVGKIYDMVKDGKNVFVAAGNSHLYRSLPALQTFATTND